MSGINKILVVEDDKEWRSIYEDHFAEDFNAEVQSASNLEDALKLAKAQRFGLYVTDGNYPLHPNGSEVKGAYINFVEGVRKLHPEAKILLITSSSQYESHANSLGIDFHSKLWYNHKAIHEKYSGCPDTNQ